MSRRVERELKRQQVIEEIMGQVVRAEDCFKGKFIYRLAIFIIHRLEDPDAAAKAKPLVRDEPVKCFFEKQILCRITKLKYDQVEANYLLTLLLEKLVSRLTAKFINSMNRQELLTDD